MSDKSIIVENISKRYRIGLLESKSDTLAGALFNYIKYPINNFKRLRSLTSFNDTNNNEETILWALKDVNFEVKEGEILGVKTVLAKARCSKFCQGLLFQQKERQY